MIYFYLIASLFSGLFSNSHRLSFVFSLAFPPAQLAFFSFFPFSARAPTARAPLPALPAPRSERDFFAGMDEEDSARVRISVF